MQHEKSEVSQKSYVIFDYRISFHFRLEFKLALILTLQFPVNFTLIKIKIIVKVKRLFDKT